LTFFGDIYEKKNFFIFFVFELLNGGASRRKKKKKIGNRFLQIARFLGGVPLK
jgi:hypothetical protein